jgi:hypothetical protein
VADPLSFEPIRDAAFKNTLSRAFKAFPRKVDQILAAENWNHFTDFMAAVERSGRVLFQFGEAKWDQKVIEEHGHETALKLSYNIVNTKAMNQLLSGAFFGIQGGDVDRTLAAAAMASLRIESWYAFSMHILTLSLAAYSEMTGGETPLDTAQPDTLLFMSLTDMAPSAAVMNKVMKAFGMPTIQHLKAAFSAFLAGELTVENLDRSIGDPALLTEIVNRCPSNPYKGIVFSAVDNPMALGYAGD